MKTRTEISKEYCIEKYREFKETHRGIPGAKEYCKFAGIDKRRLIEIYGENAYSNLQIACGDRPTKLNLERMPLDKIMQQYGDLAMEAMELGKLPSSSTWIHRRLKPSVSGLEKAPHFIKWSEFPLKFRLWAEREGTGRYKKVLEYIGRTTSQPRADTDNGYTRDPQWHKIVNDVRMWSPARRRNSEGEYKIELRKHLEGVGYHLNEEFGESNCVASGAAAGQSETFQTWGRALIESRGEARKGPPEGDFPVTGYGRITNVLPENYHEVGQVATAFNYKARYSSGGSGGGGRVGLSAGQFMKKEGMMGGALTEVRYHVLDINHGSGSFGLAGTKDAVEVGESRSNSTGFYVGKAANPVLGTADLHDLAYFAARWLKPLDPNQPRL